MQLKNDLWDSVILTVNNLPDDIINKAPNHDNDEKLAFLNKF